MSQRKPDPATHDILQKVRWLSRFLDSSVRVPGTQYRFGMDPVIGLIPGIGDALSLALSAYIIILALSTEMSAWTLTRMLFNVVLDSLLGSIPIIGDFFDVVWKANEKNRRLLEASLQQPGRGKLDRRYVLLVIVVFLASVAFSVWTAIQFLGWVLHTLRQW